MTQGCVDINWHEVLNLLRGRTVVDAISDTAQETQPPKEQQRISQRPSQAEHVWLVVVKIFAVVRHENVPVALALAPRVN